MIVNESAQADVAYQGALGILKELAGVPSEETVAAWALRRNAESKGIDSPSSALAFRSGELVEKWPEQALRDLVEALPDAIIVISSQGTIVLVNAQTERFFGYKRAEMLGWPIEKLVPQRFQAGHVAKRDHYFATPETRPMGANLTLAGQRKDGTEFPVDISLSPLRTERGIFATAVIRDISQRKRDEAKFRTLVENIPAVTFIAPLDESVPELYVSPQIEKLLGFTQKEWLEDPVLWHRQLHPDDRDKWNRQFAPTCASGEPFEAIYRFIAKDGRVVWVHGSANVVRDVDNEPLFLQGVAFDITEIKEAETALRQAQEALRESNTELDRRVRERTEALTRSVSELQDKTDELKLFAHQAAHDLKKPLSSLINWPEKLAARFGGNVDADFDKWIAKTINGAKRMRRMIEEGIAVYSDYLQQVRELPAVNCAAIVEGARANLQMDIDACDAEIIVGPLPVVIGNEYRLMLLFQNLIGNAIKYRQPERRLRIEIGAEMREDVWSFSVRDNAIGIEEKYHEKIFGLGERLHTESEIPGNGYGLSICKRIIAQRGGRMWLKSEFGVGSTFYFTWPAQASSK